MQLNILPLKTPKIFIAKGKISPQIAGQINAVATKHNYVCLPGLSPFGKKVKLIYGKNDPKADFELKWELLHMFKEELNKTPKSPTLTGKIKELFFPQKLEIETCSLKKAGNYLKNDLRRNIFN